MSLGVLDVAALEEGVDGQLERLVEDLSDQALEKGTGRRVEAGVRVHLDEVDVHLVVNHKIVAQQLKLILNLILTNVFMRFHGLQARPQSLKRAFDCFPHFRIDLLVKVDLFVVLQICREVLERYFVALLVFAVFAAILLDRVVCQVDVAIAEVIDVVFEA